jgi:hypothetical protein
LLVFENDDNNVGDNNSQILSEDKNQESFHSIYSEKEFSSNSAYTSSLISSSISSTSSSLSETLPQYNNRKEIIDQIISNEMDEFIIFEEETQGGNQDVSNKSIKQQTITTKHNNSNSDENDLTRKDRHYIYIQMVIIFMTDW